MALFFRHTILAAFLSSFLGSVLPTLANPFSSELPKNDFPDWPPQETVEENPSPRPSRRVGPVFDPDQPSSVPAKAAKPSIKSKKRASPTPQDPKGKMMPASQKKLVTDDSGIKKNRKLSPQQASEKKKMGKTVDPNITQNSKNPPPDKLRPLKKKTIILDARRLKEHKFTETIRYIKEHPDMRLKIQNMTIDADSAVSLMEGFEKANVIDQIRYIGFVMLPGPKNNQIMDEPAFIKKVLPHLGHLEGIELSCLGVSDKVASELPKKMPHLKNIALFGVGITDKTIVNLAETLPNLTKIHLTNTGITFAGMEKLIKNFPYLQALGISGQQLKDKDFKALKKEAMQNLISFSMVGQTFKEMNTIKTLLESMPRLHTLDLSETNITDDVAKFIGATFKDKQLRVVDISETPITRSGLRALVENLDLTTLKMNNLKGMGKPEIILIADKQPGLKKFYFSGANFDNPTIINLIHKLPKLMDLTLIPHPDSSWVMSEEVGEAIFLKDPKLQYLHIPAKRLPENLRINLERNPALRIEYEG